MRGSPARVAALALAGVALTLANQPWISGIAGPTSALSGVALTGGAAQTLPLASAAGVFLSWWLAGWSRRGVLALSAILIAADGALGLGPAGSTGSDAQVIAGLPWWHLASCLVAAAACAVAALSPDQPKTNVPTLATTDALSRWRMLDAGEDPSLATGEGDDSSPEWGERPVDPDRGAR